MLTLGLEVCRSDQYQIDDSTGFSARIVGMWPPPPHTGF